MTVSSFDQLHSFDPQATASPVCTHASGSFNPKPQATAFCVSAGSGAVGECAHACDSFNPQPQATASQHNAHAYGLRLNESQATAFCVSAHVRGSFNPKPQATAPHQSAHACGLRL